MDPKYCLILVLFSIQWRETIEARSYFHDAKNNHFHLDITDDQVKALAKKTDMKAFNKDLNEILVPRVVGTPQHAKVANYIVDELQQLGWTIERNKFNDDTPVFGELEFENIIAKLNPNADRFLMLACHYDSKYVREYNFVGATDSAVPCAMLLNIAKTLKNELDAIKNKNDVSLGFIFFDGEEAFRHWGPTDSIYGARHLASKWENENYNTIDGGATYQIDRLDVLVLLDLIGVKNPHFYSYFPETQKWFTRLSDAEERLAEMGMLREYDNRYFATWSIGAHIEDDHIPFLKRNTPILHIIPTPFPDVWHQPGDNRSALHFPTIENLNKIFRVFVAEYLHIKI